ncbi:Hypothetical predicted protein [Cloeon dipterum]|uniref:Uncharacterized protein n=1 Tax=Cloeon dipterum TaxID=197152 RepID=A0A8S1E850_9INSE|nr:Hypothetical predicted protein [Cloeon dipterum]
MDCFVLFYHQNRTFGPNLNDASLNSVVGETGRDVGAIDNVRATANGKPPLDDVRPSRTTNCIRQHVGARFGFGSAMSSFPNGKNGSGGLRRREELDWRWRSGGLKEDQEQRRPRRRTERINEAQQALAKTRWEAAAVAEEEVAAEEEAQEDAAAVAEVETVAAERTA